MKKQILGAAIIAAVFLIVGIIIGYRMAPDATPPEIIRETETVTRWVTTPTTCDDCWTCLRAPLAISGRMDRDWLAVTCSDPCRTAEKRFQIGCKSEAPKNYAGAAAMAIYIDGRVRILGGGEYMRRALGPVWLGGGGYSNGTDHAGKISAGMGW